MLPIAEALAAVMQPAEPLAPVTVSLEDARGRFNVSAIVAGRDEPAFDNSAMDGYAVRAEDVPGTLPVRGEAKAGAELGGTLEPGEAVRIFTGAPVPMGADAVVMQEDVTREGDVVTIATFDPSRRNVRKRGEVITKGQTLLAPGARIAAGEIGVLASQGVAELLVHRRPRVAILSTGDELVDLGQDAGPGQLYNSNAHTLAAMVRTAGGLPTALRVAKDDRDTLTRAVVAALGDHDVLITSGGVSVGEYDFVRAAFADAGVRKVFWKARIKPGKPVRFGVFEDRIPVLGLPGNPVSAFVTFEVFARPLVRRLLGDPAPYRPVIECELAADLRHAKTRTELVRARLEPRFGDAALAIAHEKQGSAALTSTIGVDALLILPEGDGATSRSTRVRAIDLRSDRGRADSPF